MLLPGVTGSGESLAVTPRSASGVMYAVFSVSLLLPLFGSATLLLPMLKFVEMVPSLMPRITGSARRTTRNVEFAPFAKLGFEQVNCGVPPALGNVGQLQPDGMVID